MPQQGFAITQSTSWLLLSTQTAKALPLLVTIWEEEPGGELERLNCPVGSQPVEQPLPALLVLFIKGGDFAPCSALLLHWGAQEEH